MATKLCIPTSVFSTPNVVDCEASPRLSTKDLRQAFMIAAIANCLVTTGVIVGYVLSEVRTDLVFIHYLLLISLLRLWTALQKCMRSLRRQRLEDLGGR